MKKVLFSLLGISAALMLGSCSTESPVDGGSVDGNTLTLSVELKRFSGTATRASIASEVGENTISSLYLLFFNQTSNLSGKFVECVDVFKMLRESSEPIELETMGMNVDIDIDFSQFPALDIGTAYNILAIANVSDNFYLNGSPQDWIMQWEDKKESEVMAAVRAYLPATIDPAAMLMHGRVERAATEPQAHIVLSRDMVRFDVTNETRNNYDLVSVSVWNSYPSTALWSQGITDYSSSVERVRRHDDTNNENNHLDDSSNPVLGDIRGGLYAFENQVSYPQPDDNVTTCLIVGIRPRLGGPVTYYRINMLQDTGIQQLRRNNVYTLTITNILSQGAPSEEIAYLGQSNAIEYMIVEEWMIDSNGTIVQDDYSQLSIATKTVQIGKDAKIVEVAVGTFSTLENPAPLAVRSQTYRPAGSDINAELDGNTLVITATALRNDETQRNGVIVISYAGLEIALSVVQAGTHDNFLIIHEPDGGIKRFPAYPGIRSGLIGVEASGPWTARIRMSGFSFNSSPALAPVTEIHRDNDPLVTTESSVMSKFEVYTHSYNMTGAMRQAYIVVTLDDDPETLDIDESEIYSGLIIMSQDEVKRITVDPLNGFATFNGAGTGLADGITGNTDTFIVDPGKTDNIYNAWDAVIEMTGSSNDTACFEIVSKTHHPTDLAQNIVVVRAKGINTSGHDYQAMLKVFTDPGTFAEIPLKQLQASFELNPRVIASTIPSTGGTSPWITVETDAGDWTVDSFEYVGTTTQDGRRLVKYDVTVEVEGENLGDSPVPFVEGEFYPVSRKFRVIFPKLYYPNREIDVGVAITIAVGGMKKTIHINQAGLKARQFIAYGSSGNGDTYGEILDTYNTGWDQGVRTISNVTFFGAGAMASNTPSNVTYLHVTPQGDAASTPWANTNDFIADRDGFIYLQGQASTAVTRLNASDSPLAQAGYPNTIYAVNTNNANGDGRHSARKIHKFIYEKGHTPLDPSNVNGLYNDGVTNTMLIPITWPESSAVILSKYHSTGTYMGDHAMLVIDAKHRFIWIGESMMFGWGGTSGIGADPTNNLLDAAGLALRDNLMYFVANTAKYGSAFSDLLLDDEDPNAMPAPWDDYWDERATGGTDNRGVPTK